MRWVIGVAGAALLATVLWDAFETIILPRRVSGRFRLTKLFYRATWRPWRAIAPLLPRRPGDAFLGFYGPLSLPLLLALWAAGIVLAFGMLQWAAGSALTMVDVGPGFGADVYMSGTTISLLDARAGSPPTAAELLWRYGWDRQGDALSDLLKEWERWAADVLESHLSYPALAYFRSQHYNQSWLGALTTILDASALEMVGLEGSCVEQARLTFAMARHAVVDLAQVFNTPPREPAQRLSDAEFSRLEARLAEAGHTWHDDGGATDAAQQLAELRRMYEPYVAALARHLAVTLPTWVRQGERPDNWQTSAWERPKVLPRLGGSRAAEDHF